jgi:hypothetical protein
MAWYISSFAKLFKKYFIALNQKVSFTVEMFFFQT